MIVTLRTERIRTLDDIRAFLDGNEAADITPHDREAAYAFGEVPQAPAGAGHALQHGALDMHDLVAEAGEQQADLVAGERASTPFPGFAILRPR